MNSQVEVRAIGLHHDEDDAIIEKVCYMVMTDFFSVTYKNTTV